VSGRAQEIGLRMALGASAGGILRLVASSGLELIGVGIVLGLAGSAAAAELVAGLVWNVSPWDPASFALVSALLLVVGLQACLWPALRAARVDPASALRHE
jgi:ABC-type antimicrobial peptide transport system permease subunit